jgi:hypothetical protein
MKRLLVLLPAALLVLSGCGDTCSTKPAELDSTAGTCATTGLAAGSQVTINAALHCQTCSETDASCLGEVVGSTLQIDAQFRECDSNKNCGAPACQVPRPTVSCRLTTPAVSGPYTLQYVSGTGLQTVSVNVGATGATSCVL